MQSPCDAIHEMRSKMLELAGKVAVVTGGSRGMGREMVRAFAERGASVVIASRKFENCVAVADEIKHEFAVDALPFEFNASNWDDCAALVDATNSAFGRVDILVNNAGASPLYPSLDTVTEALFDKVIAVNLKGPFRLSALFGAQMSTNGGGTIINIGSIEAIRPQPSALPYAAAKGGLHTLTEGFAQAYGPSVRVNTVQAGPILTDVSSNWPEGMREEMESKLALERCGQPHEIIGAVLYFATSASSYTTGAVLRVDGGWR